MNLRALRSGVTLLETILFLGILSIIATTITAVFLSTQDARALQKAVAELEDSGTQLVSTMTKTTRRAESIIEPSSNLTGSILVLQMAENDEFPTIMVMANSGMLLVQKSATSALLSPNVEISNLVFRNIGGSNVWYSFTLSTVVRTVQLRTYSRNFTGTATLFPDDQGDAGGCGSCPAPACISHAYTWYICQSDICTQSDTTFPC